jgi:hypothetical protein
MIFDGVLWISAIVARHTFASDLLYILVCTRFDCPDRSGNTYPGTISPTSPRARFPIINSGRGVGAPDNSTSPSHVADRMKRLGSTSGPAGTDMSSRAASPIVR